MRALAQVESAAAPATPSATLFSAERTAAVSASVIREILKVTQRPEVISLAGGLPAPESFPVEALRQAYDVVLRDDAKRALQYSSTEGEPELRAWIAQQETERGMPTAPDEVLVVAGSQQALDLVGKAFVEARTPLLVESPTYLGALQAFSVFGPTYRTLPLDEEGLDPTAIDSAIVGDARVMYVMPTFQNPTGRSLSAPRRRDLAQAARRHDLWIVEDDPYGELWYDVAPPPSLRAWAPERTIRVCSASKVLAPGLRIGFVIAPREVIDLLVRLKQATDLHTSTLTQRVVHRVLAADLLQRHLPAVRARYATQCKVMLEALQTDMPDGVRWTRPGGGMFVWLELPPAIDAMELLDRAIARNVAFVPGQPFYPAEAATNTLRLSFVTVAEDKLRAGVRTLASLVASSR